MGRGTHLPTGLSQKLHSLSGDPKPLLGPGTLSVPGHHRALQHLSLPTCFHPFRTPGSTKRTLRCSVHSLVGPEVMIPLLSNSERLARLWPRECFIHRKLKDGPKQRLMLT